VANILHELGHMLALRHPTCTNSAIMHQGQVSPASTSVTTHDQNNLKAKWGN
jgi:predicted Zn-dependent protease